MIIYLKLMLTAIFWGGTFIAGRFIVTDVGPYSAAFMRFVVATSFLFFFAWKVEGKIPEFKRSSILPLMLLGMTGIFAYNVFFFKGLKLISAGRASLIIALNPIFISLLSAYIFKESLNLAKLIGIALSVSGALVVISRGNLSEVISGGVGLGEIFILLCVMSWVAFSLIGKTVMKNLSPFASITYASLVGAVALSYPAFMEGVTTDMFNYSFMDWFGIFYLGFFGTVLGFVWYYEGIRKLGPMKASLFINFVPVSAIVMAFFILNEPVTLSLFTGAILVCSGVYLTNTGGIFRKNR